MKKKPRKPAPAKKTVAKKPVLTRTKKPQKKVRPQRTKSAPRGGNEQAIIGLLEGLKTMKESMKKALLALAAAAAATAAAATAIAESAGDSNDEPAPKPEAAAAPAKPAKAAACKETTTKDGVTRTCIKKGEHTEHEFPPAPEKKAEPPAKPAAEGKPDDLLDQCRAAAQEYATTFGRAGFAGVLKKYLPEGKKTILDVPVDKLPELLKELTG